MIIKGTIPRYHCPYGNYYGRRELLLVSTGMARVIESKVGQSEAFFVPCIEM